jgi:5'-nucleotidase (lipoprotein e(P4) family)
MGRMTGHRRGSVIGTLLLCGLAGCAVSSSVQDPAAAPPVVGRETVNATLWMQRAAEYRIAAEQVYGLATERLTTTIAAPGTAAVEQQGADAATLARLPTAIIVDLDETVLDNSFYQARRALAGAEFDEPSWEDWMMEGAATAVPGAVEFLQAAARAGHKVFYVTNRSCPSGTPPGASCASREATVRNLVALGLPDAGAPDALLQRGDRPEWSASSKVSRRAWVAGRYRVVALAGDDLHDFVDRAEYAQRREELAPLFGTRWFLLPNAMYGSWERALVGGACTPAMDAAACAAAHTARKYALLDPAPAR